MVPDCVLLPESRITLIAPTPLEVAIAQIVSWEVNMGAKVIVSLTIRIKKPVASFLATGS